MRIRTVHIVVAVVLVLAGCGSGGDAEVIADPELSLGRDVYGRQCASCHGQSGGGGIGPALGDGRVVEAFPNVADHRAVVVEGRGAMPSFGDRMTDEEMDAVVRYTRELLGR